MGGNGVGGLCWALWSSCSVGSGLVATWRDSCQLGQAASAWGAGHSRISSHQWYGAAGAPRDTENGPKNALSLSLSYVTIRALPLGFSDYKPHVRLDF